ncbi:MAG: hypothetical protein JO250_02650 [Armatimonadetes bacterium]|nr:hypothetical protein [Armatimonadota bacterium]
MASSGEDNKSSTSVERVQVHDVQAQALYDAFTELGSDAEMSDVSFAFEAQAEIARRE